MSTTDTRAAFEYWFSDEGAHPKAIERSSSGGYILAAASSAWNVWQAATEAAKATSVAVGEIDADAEMAKVNHDVELMGVGFLVDGKRCSLDRITWFNRPGDTWLPPPPGYPTEAARQPAPALPATDAETWLRERYGAARGHHAWRDLEEAFNAGQRTALAATAPVLSDEQIHKIYERTHKHCYDGVAALNFLKEYSAATNRSQL